MVATATPPEKIEPAVESDTALVPATSRGALAMNAIKFRIPGDTIHTATEELPDAERDALRWFGAYCRRKNLDKDQVAALLRKPAGGYYSWDSIYQALTGRRSESGASLEPMVAAIAAFRRVAEEREEQVESGFIETRLYGIIAERCKRALLRRKIGFLFGDGQIGKSECLQEYARRNNHGQTIYVEMPTQGTLTALLSVLGEALHVGRMNNASRAQRIIECFDDRMMLIGDEWHRSLSRTTGANGLAVQSFIRELYNKRRPGIMLAMTNEGRDAILHGEHRKALEQLWRRRIQPLQLPKAPFVDDLDRFAVSYGLEPAPDRSITIKASGYDDSGGEITREYTDNPRKLQATVSAEEGLGVWLTILQDASDIARASKRAITWGAVLKAYTLSQAEAEEVR
jgi:hypothetical protein